MRLIAQIFNYDGLNDGLVCIMPSLFPIGLFILGSLFAACVQIVKVV